MFIICLIFTYLLFLLSLPSSFQVDVLIFFVLLPLFYYSEKQNNIVKYSFMFGLSGILIGLTIYFDTYMYHPYIYYYLSLFLGIQFYLTAYFYKKINIVGAFSFHIILEFFRSIGTYGFSSDMAISLYKKYYLLGWARIGGIYLIYIFIFLINYYFFKYIYYKENRNLLYIILIFCIMLVPSYFIETPSNSKEKVKVGYVQGQIKEEDYLKNVTNNNDHYTWGISNYIRFTEQAAKKGAKIIILPESVFEVAAFDGESPDSLSFKNIVHSYGIDMIIGSTSKIYNKFYNSLIFLSKDAIKRYHKKRLVYMVEKQYSIDNGYQTLGNKKYTIIPLICYESIFERDTISKYTSDPGFIAVCSSDLKYKYSYLNYLHAAYSIFRAVESNRYLVRSAHRGLSFIVDNKGKIIQKAPMNKVGYYLGEIFMMPGKTFYYKYYNSIIVFYFTIFLLSIGFKLFLKYKIIIDYRSILKIIKKRK